MSPRREIEVNGMKFLLVISLLIVVLNTSGCIFAMGSHAYHEEYGEAGNRVQHILVDRGICKTMQSRSDCELYFVGTAFGGFTFQVYEITDPIVLREIRQAVRSVFDESPRLKRVTFQAWRSPHMIAIKQKEAPIMKEVFTR